MKRLKVMVMCLLLIVGMGDRYRRSFAESRDQVRHNPFVGTWQGVNPEGQSGTMTFYADMTYVLPSGCCREQESGGYSYSGSFPDFAVTFFAIVDPGGEAGVMKGAGSVSGTVHFDSEKEMKLYDNQGVLKATLTR